MTQLPHSRLLTAAARQHLRPLGLQQRGRSRKWLDDRGWWLIVVEFQPSGWSKGSYLNVGAMWLWKEQDYFSYDFGYRVESFAEFEDEAQFAPLTEHLAQRAAAEVQRYRELFSSVKSAARQLAAKWPRSFWPSFNAGVACGLAAQPEQAKLFFDEVVNTADEQDWSQAVAALAREYAAAVDDLPDFRRRIEEVIHRTRNLLRLDARADIVLD